MLFHTGTLLRLNEAELLQKLTSIVIVSGGSITSAVLGMNWQYLCFDNSGFSSPSVFLEYLVNPIRKMACTTIDTQSVIGGALCFGSINSKIVKRYRKHLFGDSTLQSLPDEPRFMLNATKVQSGALWRFVKPYARDWKVGKNTATSIGLAEVVAASSAFPPVLSDKRDRDLLLIFKSGAPDANTPEMYLGIRPLSS